MIPWTVRGRLVEVNGKVNLNPSSFESPLGHVLETDRAEQATRYEARKQEAEERAYRQVEERLTAYRRAERAKPWRATQRTGAELRSDLAAGRVRRVPID